MEIECHRGAPDMGLDSEAGQSTDPLSDLCRLARFVIDTMPDAVLWTQQDGRLVFVNNAACQSLDYTEEELLAFHVTDIVFDFTSDQWKQHWDLIKENGHSMFDAIMLRKSGEHVPVEIHARSVVCNGVEYCCAIVHDITARKISEEVLLEREEKMRELNLTKDKLFSIIAHDLKVPFNSILGFSELLMDEIREKRYEELEMNVSFIRHSAMRAMNLLVNLLDWARMQTGNLEFSPEEIDLKALIYESVDLAADAAHRKSIAIHLNMADAINIHADRAMIHTVMRNLISNAIKFTARGGNVTISTERSGDSVKISVSDDGIGMNAQALATLFSANGKLSAIGTEKEKGSGIGLILCKEFVEKHGGTIDVRSVIGTGSEFIVTIPVFRR
jgi:PAS domain S-box-containing protein